MSTEIPPAAAPAAPPVPSDAVSQAGAAIPGAVKVGEAIVDDIAAGKLPTPEEQAAADAVIAQATELAPQIVKEAKAGYKTTEFWFTAAIALLTLLGTFPLPPKLEAVVAAALAAAYTISRGLAKAGTPVIEPPV